MSVPMDLLAFTQDQITTPSYFIYRDYAAFDSSDHAAAVPLAFFPEKDSDELHDALRAKYPHLRTHTERIRDATLDFLLEEAEMLAGDYSTDTSPWQQSLQSMSNSPADTSSPSFDSSITRSVSSESTYAPGPMTTVFSLTSAQPPKLKTRRKMTDAEKLEYKKRRQMKACEKCAKRKRKCTHDRDDDSLRQTQKVTKPATTTVSKSSQHAAVAGPVWTDMVTRQGFDDFTLLHENPLPEALLDVDHEANWLPFVDDFMANPRHLPRLPSSSESDSPETNSLQHLWSEPSPVAGSEVSYRHSTSPTSFEASLDRGGNATRTFSDRLQQTVAPHNLESGQKGHYDMTTTGRRTAQNPASQAQSRQRDSKQKTTLPILVPNDNHSTITTPRRRHVPEKSQWLGTINLSSPTTQPDAEDPDRNYSGLRRLPQRLHALDERSSQSQRLVLLSQGLCDGRCLSITKDALIRSTSIDPARMEMRTEAILQGCRFAAADVGPNATKITRPESTNNAGSSNDAISACNAEERDPSLLILRQEQAPHQTRLSDHFRVRDHHGRQLVLALAGLFVTLGSWTTLAFAIGLFMAISGALCSSLFPKDHLSQVARARPPLARRADQLLRVFAACTAM